MTERYTRLGLCLSAVLVALTATVGAHLAVVKTAPGNETTLTEPPAQIQVWFNQQPSPRVSRLEMRGPDGVVALGPVEINRQEQSISAAVKGPLSPGTYEVTWRTAGDDGHVIRGTFVFSLPVSD
jgi:methionine-rich copper-binding protein CopC